MERPGAGAVEKEGGHVSQTIEENPCKQLSLVRCGELCCCPAGADTPGWLPLRVRPRWTQCSQEE